MMKKGRGKSGQHADSARVVADETSSDSVVRSVGDGSSAISSLTSALNDSKFSDVIFVLGTKEFHAHRAILAARSEVFYQMLYGGMKESHEKRIVVEAQDPDNFFTVLQWAYSGRVRMSAREVLGVLQLANYYAFPDLEEHCRTLASSFIDNPNVVSLLDSAIEIGEESIIDLALAYISVNAITTISQPSWLTLCKMGVEKVLALDELDCAECLLYDRTMDWIQHNSEGDAANEKSLLAAFLPRIRLPQLSVKDLLEKVKPTVNTLQVHFQEYVEALEYKLCPQHFFSSPSASPPNAQSFRSRKPTYLGKITLNTVPVSFLDGWTLVVEQDARMALDEEKLRGIHPSAVTYVCVGERVRGTQHISVIAVGHVEVALRRSNNVQHFFQDGSVYWCNAPTQLFGFSPTPDQRTSMDMNPIERDKKLMWNLGAPGTVGGSAISNAAATSGDSGFGRTPFTTSPELKLRFVYVK
ncbi:Hypothetical protein, putative [Bodo saltans]|uniref:BTB domain-containing protein n=1 Tax=Bodo saltans TaxID=75058 RepID=A0A0S4JGN3_BODSA|nr:Hypothetical protein, putative [Bodo saltans]|eukprot:CUG88140.1 Hypothetical protein, putative [Bodo saltans]